MLYYFQLFDRALQLGCGQSLDGVLRSPDFALDLRSQLNLKDEYPLSTKQGVVLRAGHLEVGKLFNGADARGQVPTVRGKKSERKVIKKLRESPLQFDEPTYEDCLYRALIHTLGRELERQAAACLPEKIVHLAQNWRNAPTSWQYKITNELLTWLQSGNLELENDEHYLLNFDCSPLRFLPRLSSQAELISNVNCFGKVHLMAGFAYLANIKYLFVSLYQNAFVWVQKWKADLYQRILEFDGRYPWLIFQAELRKAITQSLEQKEKLQQIEKSFHCAVAFQLRNKDWILLDPNFNSRKYEEERLQYATNLLDRYQKVLPGLSIDPGSATTGGLLHDTREMIYSSVFEILSIVKCFIQCIELLIRSENTDMSSISILQTIEVYFKTVAGGAIEVDIERFKSDQAYAQEKANLLATYLLTDAVNLIKEWCARVYPYALSPAGMLKACPYALGIETLWSINNNCVFKPFDRQLFIDNGFDLLHYFGAANAVLKNYDLTSKEHISAHSYFGKIIDVLNSVFCPHEQIQNFIHKVESFYKEENKTNERTKSA